MKIFLIGFMGSGKSTWGRRLAGLLERPFLDLDELIEQESGRSVTALFREEGEERFRVLEHEILRRVVALPGDPVVAVGGGTPCYFDNMDLMRRHGLTIYLQHPPEVLASYLREEQEKRPLIAGMDEEELLRYIYGKLAEREPYYRRADRILTWPEVDLNALHRVVEESGA